MRQNKTFYKILSLLLLLISQNVLADVFVIIADKEEKKKSVSWNLLDWMETKKQFALMDQWLALNTNKESIFEGYIGGEQAKYEHRTDTVTRDQTMNGGSLGLFVSLLGLEAQYEKSDEKHENLSYQLSLRIFGPYKQSTNITLFYGMRDQKLPDNEKVQNQFWGGSFTLYLFRFLGGEVNYRRYLKGTAKVSSSTITGDLLESSAFIDVYFVRLYGTVFKERTNATTTLGVSSRSERQGSKFGLKIFF